MELEKNTRGQSTNSLWHENENQRITVSKCYRCAVLKDSTSQTKAFLELLGFKEFPPTKEMMERLAQEPEIIQEYLASMNENGRKGIKVETLGLIVNVNHVFFFWQLLQMG